MAILRTVLLAMFVVWAGGIARAEGNRVAVVIGNSGYQNAPALKNPANDATDIGSALAQLGFKVTLRLDATKRQLDQTLEQFSRDARTADAALLFYAGHGMQFQGRNFLVPVDAELMDEVSLRYETTAVDEVKDALKSSKGVKILILDSCRDNPLANRLSRSLQLSTRDLPRLQGFAREEGSPGMIIVYSTQPDEVAHDGEDRNSPFSAALLRELKEPGLEIGALFRRVESDVYKATGGAQSPELSISMAPEYYLNQSETDQTIWARIRDGADAPALKEFVARFPQSFYAPDARARLDLIEARAREQTESDHAVRAASAEAERLKSRQQDLDAAAHSARSHEDELAQKLADAEKEKALLREQLAATALQRAKESEDARLKATRDSQDQAQREAALRAEMGRLQTSESEKEELVRKALESERARAAAEAQAAKEVEQRAAEAAGEKARADAERMKAITEHEAELAAEAAKAQAEAESQAHQAAEAREAAEVARQQVASASAAASAPRPEPSPDVLPQIRDQLRRLGCFSGADLDWGAPALRLGVAKYVRYASLGAVSPAPDQSLLDAMKRRPAGFCPPECSVREIAVGGRCIAKTCPEGERLTRSGSCVRPPPARSAAIVRPRPPREAPEPREAAPRASGGGRCFSFNGSQYCE